MIKPSAERQMSHDLKKDRVEEVLIGCKDEEMEGHYIHQCHGETHDSLQTA